MVADGEVDALVAERVWRELARGLMVASHRACSRCCARRRWPCCCRGGPPLGRAPAARLPPRIDTGVHLMMVLDMAAQFRAALPVRFACLGHDLGKGAPRRPMCCRATSATRSRSARLLKGCAAAAGAGRCRELADVVARRQAQHPPQRCLWCCRDWWNWMRCDAFRKPQRFAEVLLACELRRRGRLDEPTYPWLSAAAAGTGRCAGGYY